jgi:prephenate dehydratase
MQAAALGETDGAVIPIENSTAGRVAGVHLLLHSNQLTIRAEHFLPVNHQLLALPGADPGRHQTGGQPSTGLGAVPRVP